MLEYDRINVSEGIDVNKNKYIYKKFSLCKFYYFLDKNFNYGPYLYTILNTMRILFIWLLMI